LTRTCRVCAGQDPRIRDVTIRVASGCQHFAVGIRGRRESKASTARDESLHRCACEPACLEETRLAPSEERPQGGVERRDSAPGGAPLLTARQRLIAFCVALFVLAAIVIATRSTELFSVAITAVFGMLTWLGSGRAASTQG
jgi:hypothetical protein